MNNKNLRGNSRMNETYYVEGNTVRKLYAEPSRRTREYEKPQRVVEAEPKTKPQVMSLTYTAFLTFAMICTLASCVYMLSLQSKVTSQRKHISASETTLNNMINDNEATSARLEAQINLDDIYNIATNELGMVYATRGQVVYYESSDPDYLIQYKDVPENK